MCLSTYKWDPGPRALAHLSSPMGGSGPPHGRSMPPGPALGPQNAAQSAGLILDHIVFFCAQMEPTMIQNDSQNVSLFPFRCFITFLHPVYPQNCTFQTDDTLTFCREPVYLQHNFHMSLIVPKISPVSFRHSFFAKKGNHSGHFWHPTSSTKTSRKSSLFFLFMFGSLLA